MFVRYCKPLKHSRRCYSTFETLGISPATCQKLKSNFNIIRPTLAQEQFIPLLLEGKRDILLRDNTGTGKSFGIAITLASLIPSEVKVHKSVHSIYIAPNQELALQIGHWIQKLTDTPNVKLCAGLSEEEYSTIPHTVIGTPGRILDIINEGKLPTHAFDRLIIDEADQAFALPKRYAPVRQQNKRAKHPKPAQLLLDKLLLESNNNQKIKRQLMVASATLNRPLRHFVTSQKGWLRSDPLFVDISKGTRMSEVVPVQHHCLLISDDAIRNLQTEAKQEEKAPSVDFDDTDDRMIDSIAALQEVEPVRNGILFIDSATSVEKLRDKLASYNVKALNIKDYAHQAQQQHDEKSNSLWIATEFSARGIDIPNVSHVFILGQPSSPASYLHMAGRTGRLGPEGFRSGKVISLIREQGWTEAKMANMYKLLDIPLKQYEYVQ
ncbi:P-loop containing nucleoside triphosphate hydrolase protein [Mycotypha africana]|uniref:P-loop containing nucleoside triphosphate hydrolase protein n=1 Tax=Mycotypha africana TaxID=64632 RepID=UPI0022FFFD3F|nr:P-loop containing nucleoside triphosphate hydrolase protein [Mycotypha africana]KAI8984418.1 P-loop containing nucleoside triphosphate hydrolase protein [Mycotypha africana]